MPGFNNNEVIENQNLLSVGFCVLFDVNFNQYTYMVMDIESKVV